MSALTYIPPEPPPRPFAVGDEVEKLDRNGRVMASQRITKVGKRRVTTDDKRGWRCADGWWWDGEAYWPFPSIRLARPSGGRDS